MTTKLNLNTSPYFDDFTESKKFYKILFRPGRSVQARELNQIQSILQNQVARLGGFSQGDLVHPSGLIGARYNNTAVFLKVIRTDNPTALIATDAQINMYWLGKFVTNEDGVKGKIIGYDTVGNVVRFFVDLTEAGKTFKNFRRGDNISVVQGTLSFKVENNTYSTGRIARVSIPESIYFFNDYYVLVDEQTLFLTPDNRNNDAEWNTRVTFDVGIKMTESIVRHDQDETLLDNASGTSNYGGAGADRLKIEGLLVKRQNQTIEQNFIRILTLKDGQVTDAPLVEKENLGIKSDAEARRIYEESGNYTVTPFLANAMPFLDTEDTTGLFSEESDLSFGYTEEDDINRDQAQALALQKAKDLFKMNPPQIFEHTNNRFYPGTSYSGPEATSFLNLCEGMIGIRVEPGVAYVQGYRAGTAGITSLGVRKARSSDYQPERKIQTPIGQYILITNVFGSPEISNSDWPYDDIELHSAILDISTSSPEMPNITTKIGTARVCSINLQSGSSGSSSATYQLGVFDLALDEGYTFEDVKSIYSNGRSTTGKDFVANLVLKNSVDNPWIIFDGTVSKIAEPYSIIQKTLGQTVDNPSMSLSTDKLSINIDFAELANRNTCYEKLTLGTAIKINSSNLVRVITDVKKVDDFTAANTNTATDNITPSGTQTIFTLTHIPIVDDNLKVFLGGAAAPTLQKISVVNEDGSSFVGDPDGNEWDINGSNDTFALVHKPIETRDTRVIVHVDEEYVSSTLINGVNRTFPIQNAPISSAIEVYINGTKIASDYYQVSNGKLTFINLPNTNTNKVPQTGDAVYFKYNTYINSVSGNKIILSMPPVINSKIKVSYSYNSYVVDNKSITFAVPPTAGTTVEYKYTTARRVKITLDSAINFDNAATPIEKLEVVKKIVGKGTTWKSNPLQSVEKGDWVQIGTDSNKKLYRVFSTPANDNELNLDPDPSETEIINGTKTFVNAPWPDDTKMTYLIPEDVRNLGGQANCGLLYKLPHNHIRTIRGGSKNAPNNEIELTYTARRYETKDVASGIVTVTVNASNEDVIPFSSNLYSLVDLETGIWFQLFDANTPDEDAIGEMDPSRPETFKAKVIVNSDNNLKNVVFKTTTAPADGVTNRKYAVGIPVTKRLKEGTKTLRAGGFDADGKYTNGISSGSGALAGFVVTPPGKSEVSFISLGVPDVVNVTRIVCVEDGGKYGQEPTDRKFDGDSWTENGLVHKDITGAYTVNTGQTDFYYGIASVRLRPNMPVPQGKVRVEFDYYEHPTENFDYFSVDSYISSGLPYDQIPLYTSSSGVQFDLKRCIDFRPVVNRSTPEIQGKKVFQFYKETPISNLVCSYHVYEERKDLLYASKTGELLIKEGSPALDSAFPSEAIDGMSLYTISLKPYTTTMSDVVLEMVDNRRYTMRDIGLLEKRIKNVEHFTSLNLIEKNTKDLTIKDSLGQDKYKHGFMTDTFENVASANIGSQEFSSAIDSTALELKPPIQINNIPLIESVLMLRSETSQEQTIELQEQKRAANNYARADKNTPNKKSSLYTLRYDNVTFIEQPICSRVINVNPYAVQSFAGTLKINPWTDTWRELKQAEPRVTYDSSEYERQLKNFNSSKQRIDWGTPQREILGVTDTGYKKDGRRKPIAVNRHWPAKDGKYLIWAVARDQNGRELPGGKWVLGEPSQPEIKKGKDGKLIYKPGTRKVKIPPGLPGEGEIVDFYENGNVRNIPGADGWRERNSMAWLTFGETRTITTTVQEFTEGTMSTLVDRGFVQSAKFGNKIVDISAATNIRKREIQFEGKGFFPNTRLYAFFDNKPVTEYCVPDKGFGEIEDDVANKVFRDSSVALQYGKNFIATGNATSAQKLMNGFSFQDIKADPELNFAVLQGKVTTEGTTLKGSFSELTLPANSPYESYENFTIVVGDTIQGATSGARGLIKGISSDKKTLYYDALTDVSFNATSEQIEIKNDETIVVLKEATTKINDYTYELQKVPISGQGSDYQPLVVYLKESFTGTPVIAPVWHIMDPTSYSITENTKVIKFANNTPPQNIKGWQNRSSVWSVEADYTYKGSNYFINNEIAELSGNLPNETKKFAVKHDIIPGTLSFTFTGGSLNPIPTFTTSGRYITFSVNIPNTITVSVKYSTVTQVTIGRQVKSGTKFLTELVKKTSTSPGSVVTFATSSEEREIVNIIDNATATLDALLTTDITTDGGVECADKLEALQKRYLSKFVDIFGADTIENNILNTKINSITYKPNSTTDKLTFHFDSSLMMDAKTETVELYIKKNPTSAGVLNNTNIILKCNQSGTIRGRFCIPDPNIPGNPTFTTGDKTFRLTNSSKNESLSTVSRADAGYTARGWIDTQAEDILMVRRWDIEEQAIKKAGEKTTYSQVFQQWGDVCAADPIAQSFQVKEKGGIFITAVDVFFYSKDPFLPVRLQIRPLSDGGSPSNKLLYEMSLESDEVVVNKVNLKDGTVTVYGATSKTKSKEGFNKGPWNTQTSQANGVYSVTSYAYRNGMSYTIEDGNKYNVAPGVRNPAAIEYGFGSDGALKNAQSHMIPTRFVFEYPLYLAGDNKNYCFVLLSDSVPGDQAGGSTEILESTYQAYFAQQGKIYDHQTLATPVHRQAPLMAGEEDINFILGTGEVITRIPQADGNLFKSQNGISWVADPIADLKFAIHKAKFDTTRAAEITFVNDTLEYAELGLSPFETRAGSSKVRVHHNNHNFCPNSLVSFTDVQGDLNGLMPQQIIEPKVHVIESVNLDSYVIDLGDNNTATFSGNVGGASVRASTNIRYEEIALVANPLVVENTNITWRLSGLQGAGTHDVDGQQNLYNRLDDVEILPNIEEPLVTSMVVCSDKNEKEFNPINENEDVWENKSLKIIATFTSNNENISPILDTERLSAIAKTVRLNNPYGVGYLNNINDKTFDEIKILPSGLVPGSNLPRKLYFSDTDSNITGSEFEINYRKVTGEGSIFTVELSVGDVIKCPINSETRKVVEIASDTELTIDAPFTVIEGTQELETGTSPNVFNVKTLSANPPQLRFKTSDQPIAAELSKISVGKYISLSGTLDGDRDFFEKKVVSVVYTPTNTITDPELGAPRLCEVVVDHVLRDGVEGGFEIGSSNAEITLTLLNEFVDDIATSGTSSAAKYISKELVLANPANTLKIMFDGCRPEGSEIDLYYITEDKNPSSRVSNIWKKLDYSIEDAGVLRLSKPPNDPNHDSLHAYEANAVMINPFISAQVKIVLRGGDCARYPKVKNLRIIALEE